MSVVIGDSGMSGECISWLRGGLYLGGGVLVLLAVDGVLGFEVEMVLVVSRVMLSRVLGFEVGSVQSDVVVDFVACRGGLKVLSLL